MPVFQDSGHKDNFMDRRQSADPTPPGVERRQFANSHTGLSPDARELAEAIDEYKIRHSRRYITFEEMLHIIQEIGYSKREIAAAAGGVPVPGE
jgi:hypothetical protein